MPDDRKPPGPRTPPKGVSLTFTDKRDELVHKHATPHLNAPHTVPYETTGVHVRQRVDSISTSIEQLKLDQIRQNNQQESQGAALENVRTDVAGVVTEVVVLSTKVSGLDDKLDIVTDLVRNRERVVTETTVADTHLTRVRKTTEIEDRAGRTKLKRTVIGAVIAALSALAGAAAHYLAGGSGG